MTQTTLLSRQRALNELEQDDVTPDFFVEISSVLEAPHKEHQTLTAYDIPSLCRRLFGFCNADLKQIPVLPGGSRLEQGATYLDLTERPPRAFMALDDMEASAGHFYASRSQVPERLWNRLLGRPQPDPLWMRLSGGGQPDRTSPSNRQRLEAEGKQRARRI